MYDIDINIDNRDVLLQEIVDPNLSARVEELLTPVGIHVSLYLCFAKLLSVQ